MSQTQPTTTKIFRTSLRDWQAKFKQQQQAEQPAPAADRFAALFGETAEQSSPADAAQDGPVRDKKLIARKKRKLKNAAIAAGKA